MKIFEKLLAGSAEINRMLAAINQIASSTLGMLDSAEIREESLSIPCGHHHVLYFWTIKPVLHLRTGQTSTSRLVVEFYVNDGDSGDLVPSRLIFSTNPANERMVPALEDVKTTYDALEALVEFLMIYPAYAKKLEFLVAAAKAVAK